jgi:cell division protein FtsQ
MPAPDRASTRAAMQVLAALPAPLRARVASVAAPAPDAVTLHLRGGRTVVWGSAANSARKALVAAVLLRRAGRTVDVSAPGIAVLR